MAHAHTSRTFVLMPNSSLKLYPFRDWQRYDSFGIELVSRLMDGRISHDTASSCKRHSPRSADVHDGESSRIREEQLKNSLWITVGAAFYSKNLKNIYMYVTLEVIYNFLSVFLSLYTQRTKSINNSSHTHTNARARHWHYLSEYTSGADKSLARPGRKRATATKLGIFFNVLPTKINTFPSQLL